MTLRNVPPPGHSHPYEPRTDSVARRMARHETMSTRAARECLDYTVAEHRRRGNSVTTEFLLLIAIGFMAQLIDGALGMAYGVLTNGALLMLGLPPAHASALVHTAEIFTTGASAASHIYHRNVDWRFVMRLGIPGVLGAILGAWILSNLDLSAAR